MEVLVSKNLKIVEKQAMRNSRLQKLIGSSLETIKDRAFAESGFLNQIDLQNVKSIGCRAFAYCSI